MGDTHVSASNKSRISLKFVNQTGEETYFLLRRKAKMSNVFAKYCEHHKLQIGAVRFFYNGGSHIPPSYTPLQLQMEEGDQIDVMAEVNGGALLPSLPRVTSLLQ